MMLKLNLGCGQDKLEGFVNIDRNPKLKPDVLWDLNEFPYPFEDQSVDFIQSTNVIEHLYIPLDLFFREMFRILKMNGSMRFTIPNMFCLQNRIMIPLGLGIRFLNGWFVLHNLFIHPRELMDLLYYVGFDVESKPLVSIRRTIDLVLRKRPH